LTRPGSPKRVAPTVAVVTCGLALLALATWEIAKGTVLQERAMNRCTLTPPPALDPHYATRAEAGGVSVKWHTLGYECEYTRRDGTVVHLPPPP